MNKHTPGPWVIEENPTIPETAAERDRLKEINVELLSLLKEARSTLEMWKDVAPAVSLCADIDNAITKATGEK